MHISPSHHCKHNSLIWFDPSLSKQIPAHLSSMLRAHLQGIRVAINMLLLQFNYVLSDERSCCIGFDDLKTCNVHLWLEANIVATWHQRMWNYSGGCIWLRLVFIFSAWEKMIALDWIRLDYHSLPLGFMHQETVHSPFAVPVTASWVALQKPSMVQLCRRAVGRCKTKNKVQVQT